METLAQDIWVFDGNSVPFFGLPFSTRMTVVRLSGGDLWVHSPIAMTPDIQSQLEELGTVKYLIAPNHLHHLFLPDWISIYPDAEVFGTDEVIKKRQDIQFNASLNSDKAWPWCDDIAQVLFSGSPLMQECVFFHKQSKTLVVTDLVENFSGKQFNYWQRLVAKGVGILAPNGKTPLDWRLSFMFGKADARKHLECLLQWDPHVLVMSHGEIVRDNAKPFLIKSFKWLV
ncbi:DUF4336 domain-containing protein [Vibrio sp. JPW-9-11-11]|uniref:DUF4336 domain-containing protein n=1 Tax=Vibrio sp. JPW-9-11-11 TaxID=1416532 RepID=UPI001592FF3A|nr:DUF4336 domain-containing protein [Vibrio sp. JPW-9-11-11]NVD06490.1 DUF4336 domain-containing protein [Vibrio sp. JPW-9-11-11]